MSTVYRIKAKVEHLEQKKITLATYKDVKSEDPKATIQQTKSAGWFVHFEGSYESLFMGDERPVDLEPGTEVDILIIPRPK
jgi:predicted RNA-binding protein (virulence factor B family)